MLFQTIQTHGQLRTKIHAFAEEEVKSIVFSLDQANEFPAEAVKRLGELGPVGTPCPKEYGGAGLDAISYAIAVEELFQVDGGTGVILSVHVSLGSWPIFVLGTEGQKKKYLILLARGEKIGTFGLTKPNAGSDTSGTETTVMDKGNHWLPNGGKIFIIDTPKTDTYAVFAITTPNIGTRGISVFIVEKGWKGFEFGGHYDKMGIRSSFTAKLISNDVKVPKENLLGGEGDGFKIVMATLDGGRIGTAVQALGIAQGVYRSVLERPKERVQFGKPIAVQQSLVFKLTNMAIKLYCARFLIYSVAELKKHHEPYDMESAMAKMHASDITLGVTSDAVQIPDGTGFLKGMDVEQMYCDAKITTIYEGINKIQRVVIVPHLIGKVSEGSGSGSRFVAEKPASITGMCKRQLFRDGASRGKVAALVEALKKDGHDFTAGILMDVPTNQAKRMVSTSKGISDKKNMKPIENPAKATDAAVGSSRPVAETPKYVPLSCHVGMSDRKFAGNLYIARGISSATQHLKGIKDAPTIVAINRNGNAPTFKNCNYGTVGDVNEILPLSAVTLDTGEKQPAPPMVKMKRPPAPKPEPISKRYVCGGCGHEYVPELGDEDIEIAPGALFENLPEDQVRPECAGSKDQFIEAQRTEGGITMYCVRKAIDDLYWVGVNDHRLHLFENIYPIPRGVSYNVYLPLDGQSVLFDTVDWSVYRQLQDNLDHLLGDKPLGWLVVNHMESGHGVSVEQILRCYPKAEVISTEKFFILMRRFGFHPDEHERVEAKEGDIHCFDKHTATFMGTPTVHQPGVMVAFDTTSDAPFSVDAFGSFITLDGKPLIDEASFDQDWIDGTRRYLTNIVGRYDPHIQLLPGKAADILDQIKFTCPLHGPVWRKDLGYSIDKYDGWSRYEPEEEDVMIVYASMHGNTEAAAQTLTASLCEEGVTNVSMYSVFNTHVSYLIFEASKCGYTVLASVTYNLGIYPMMKSFLEDMKVLNLQNRIFALIENGSWVYKSGDLMQKFIDEKMKGMIVLDERLSMTFSLFDDKAAELDALVNTLVDSIQI